MKNCPNCHNQAKDDALFCPVCGTMLDAVPQPSTDYFKPDPIHLSVPVPVVPARSIYDHTEDFEADDIQNNRLSCMIAYLLDFAGVIVALLMSGSSEYTQFHIRQSLKFTVLEALLFIASVLFCWTFVIPIIGIILLVILMIIKFVCFLDVCKGKAKDAPIIRSLKFLN